MKYPETRYAVGSEGAVAYQVFGDGELDLLFVTPWHWNIEAMWEQPLIERYFRQLASFSRVIVFDKRGTGVSDPVPVGALSREGRWSLPTLEQWTDDVSVVLDAAEARRVALIGNMEGAQMAILFAATHPERTAALVCFDGAACYLRHDDYPAGLPSTSVDRAVAYMFTEVGEPRSWMAPSLENDDAFQRWRAHFARLAVPPSIGVQMFRHGIRWDVRPALPSIQVPTLVLHREGNAYIHVGNARYLADHVAGAQLVVLPGDDPIFYAGDQDATLTELRGFLTGAREVVDHDRVLATVLFTDIVGSTERAVAVGDRHWREVLDAHDRIAAEQVEQHRGRMIKNTGDGILATFDGPARAIRCAHAMQTQSNRIGLPLRAGLHTGEVELRGADIGGVAVALAARVMALAGPSEVLVSATVKDLVIGSGIAFEDRGAYSLRGIPGEWNLFSAIG